ncbi:MAG TPA: superoxide dismutase [Spirochaetota bacterium]|nr:superoxide dismutase [Spirochaetota bacterium]HPI89576.1 superoxide dismutase [Spirochaetota bacterium]HPR49040.1 superoxide dismutase [Spirochaetota bacterium]
MTITLPELPYTDNALEPYISARTLEFHYGKHHRAYVDNLVKLIEGTGMENMALKDIVIKSAGDPSMAGIFNNSAQAWNHSFYWKCMKKNGGGMPGDRLLADINSAFGSYGKFLAEIKNAAVTQFGSGWAWLVLGKDGLKLMKTLNADTPIAHGQKALLTIDVWEHAYYLDYQNRRPDYVSTFFESLVNWDFVESQR